VLRDVEPAIMTNTVRISNLRITGKRLNIHGKGNEKLIDLIANEIFISLGVTDA